MPPGDPEPDPRPGPGRSRAPRGAPSRPFIDDMNAGDGSPPSSRPGSTDPGPATYTPGPASRRGASAGGGAGAAHPTWAMNLPRRGGPRGGPVGRTGPRAGGSQGAGGGRRRWEGRPPAPAPGISSRLRAVLSRNSGPDRPGPAQ